MYEGTLLDCGVLPGVLEPLTSFFVVLEALSAA